MDIFYLTATLPSQFGYTFTPPTMFRRFTSKTRSFAVSVLTILLGQAAAGAFALVTEISYARVLGPAARGLVSLCLMSITFGALVGGAGGESSIVYWSSRERGGHARWFPAALLWGVLGSGASVLLWWSIYWKLGPAFLRGIPPVEASLVLCGIPSAVAFSYCMALFTGVEQFATRSAAALLRQFITVAGFGAALLFAGRTAEAALIGIVGGFFLASVASAYAFRRNLAGFWRLDVAAKNLTPTLSYGLRGQIGNLAAFFTYRLDVFVINFFLPLADLGYYVLGVTISEALWQIPAAVASALFPRTARTTPEDATAFTCLAIRQVLAVTLIGAALLALACPIAVPLVFGARFRPSVSVVLWLLPGTVALSVAKVACSDLAGRGKNGYSSIFSLICLVLTIGLDFWMIPWKGITGASMASSAAYLADTVLILAVLRRELNVGWRMLLVPAPSDMQLYWSAWNRVQHSLSTLRTNSLSNLTPTSMKGD